VGRGTLDARITAITQRRDGSLWVGTHRAGIFRVRPNNPLTVVVATAACFGTAITACVRLALRATRIDSLSALRAD